MPDLPLLVADLRAEQEDLDDRLARLAEFEWARQTPAVGWSIQDQVTHLAFFDEAATLALLDADAFRAQLAAVGDEPGQLIELHVRSGRVLASEQVFAWWQRARMALLEALGQRAGAERVTWYGPSMNVASLATARLMEVWAHGQDVVDALELEREPTARLRHVAHLGVRARPYSFAVRGLEVPSKEVYVELVGPSGVRWTWGQPGSSDRVAGTAVDFCWVVTQRRHLTDTELVVTGRGARAWMAIAQAFAGPPGAGRQPGQFARPRRPLRGRR
jgi:uncharacterized protein (TIGR03084 family)